MRVERGVLRVLHMAEPNVTLMTGSLDQKPARRIAHLAYLCAPSVMRPVQPTFQFDIQNKKAVDYRFGINLKIILLLNQLWPKSGADKTGP